MSLVMRFLVLLLLSAGLSQSQAVPEARFALIGDGQEKRTLPTCTYDNLYRIFVGKRYSSSASAFCSIYITGTRVSTNIAKVTAISYTSVTDVTPTITTIALAATVTANSAIAVVPKAKRQGVPAAFAPGQAGTYPPNRISSACSCLVSPLVMVRQLGTGTSTSTQTWTRHFTRLTAIIETIISTTNTAAASSAVILLYPATSTSVAAASTDSPVESPAALLSDSAPTTSFAAPSTTTGFAAASTSTVETTPPAPYCSGGDILLDLAYSPLCGVSFIPETPDPSTQNTVNSYMDCAILCNNDTSGCQAYSYLLTATEDNCYIFNIEQLPTPYADPNVDSGEVDS